MFEHKPLVIGDLSAKIPVIQGGMGVGVSLSNLAGSVAACEGVGVLSTAQIGWREPDFHRNPLEANFRAIGQEIQKAREISKGRGILGINIMVATQNYKEYVIQAVKNKIDLIISGAGLPIDLPAFVAGSRTKIAPIVSSLKSAKVLCRMWDRRYQTAPDLVVIEGPQAGGHLGFGREELETINQEKYDEVIRSIVKLVREYAEKYQKKIPVVVAGGIFERQDLEHALDLGADGVQMGTRFVTTQECDVSNEYKQAYLNAQKEDICIVKSPVGMPGRAICNEFVKKTRKERIPVKRCHHCIATCNPREIPYCITDALVHAAEGNLNQGLIFCGANAWRCRRIETVEEIMREFA